MKITRTGTWPILKYTMRSEHGHYNVIMIDDEHGDIFVNPGEQIAFQHWWGQKGRGEKKLRQFLIRASHGYLEDKFSYGLNRWSSDQAEIDLKRFLIEYLGPESDWSYEVQEAVESAIECDSKNLFLHILWNCDEISNILCDHGTDLGELGANPRVLRFIEKDWPAFVEFWKQELAEEELQNETQNP